MKKLLPIIIIIALVAIVLCFAACGNKTMDNTITSMSNEMTTIMDELSSDMNNMTDSMFEDTTDLTDFTDNSGLGDNTTEVTADENGKVTAE